MTTPNPKPMASSYYMSARYETYEYEDETSQFDPLGRWQYGTECFVRIYRVRVPRGVLGKPAVDTDPVSDWIARNCDKDIWL